MATNDRDPLLYTRRDFGMITLAGLPLALAFAKVDSKIKGVQIGAITYSFRTIPDPNEIIRDFVSIGLGEMELMSGDAEKLAGAPLPGGRGGGGGGRPGGAPGATPGAGPGSPPGAGAAGAPGGAPSGPPPSGPPPSGPPPTGGQPPGAPGAPPAGRQGGGRAPLTPEQQAARDAAQKALHDWRMSATEGTFKPVRKKIEDAGIDLRVLCYNMSNREQNRTKDDEIEYAFLMAKALGVKAISTSTQVSMAKRLAPFAEKHKMPVGFHGHANVTDPEEVAKPESFEAVMAESKFLGANLDIGHYTEAGYDPVEFLQKHHARITNLHLKDKKKATNGGGNFPWGQGDTPIKEVLKVLQKNKWDIPANIEFEHQGEPVAEVTKCFQLIKEMLA